MDVYQEPSKCRSSELGAHVIPYGLSILIIPIGALLLHVPDILHAFNQSRTLVTYFRPSVNCLPFVFFLYMLFDTVIILPKSIHHVFVPVRKR